MVKTEYYKTRKDGVVLNRSYSDAGMMIERDGVLYSEAIDPANTNRTYTETTIQIVEEISDSAALDIIVGGTT